MEITSLGGFVYYNWEYHRENKEHQNVHADSLARHEAVKGVLLQRGCQEKPRSCERGSGFAPKARLPGRLVLVHVAGCPTQARFWLEWEATNVTY